MQILAFNSTTIISGTCDECLCTMLMNTTTISSFNCFHNNQTCEIFSESVRASQLSLMNNLESSVYFISLPVDDTHISSFPVSSTITSTTLYTTAIETTTTAIGPCVSQPQPSILEYTVVNITCVLPTPNINILYACYGVNDLTQCDCRTSACTKMNVTQYLTTYCTNSSTPSTCQFRVGGPFFVDTCSGRRKDLWLTYNCT